jgi:hypothetical protein
MLRVDSQPFAETSTNGDLASNGDLTFTVTASRSIHIESQIVSGSGKTSHVTWTQNYTYASSQQWMNDSLIQVGWLVLNLSIDLILKYGQNLQQQASGHFSSSHDDQVVLEDSFAYPLNINFTNLNTNFTDCVSFLLFRGLSLI